MKKIAFYTLGCKLNFSETSTIAKSFEKEGFTTVAFEQKPDIFIINTCSVTENADKKCKKIVKEAKKISPHSYVIIMGCYAQLKPKEISEIQGVDAVFGASEKFNILHHIKEFTSKKDTQVFANDIKKSKTFFPSFEIGSRTRTFLKVQDGCSYGCSFCTIPLARGKSRSASVKEIIEQVHKTAEYDIKEIVLTGVNIGDFGIINGKRKESFFELLQQLEKIESIERFRISSIEPNLLSNEIIHFVAKSKRIVHHFHIPLQSGSDMILRKMNRRYLTDLYADRIKTIKSLMPDCCIGVDVIVGFPGESEEDFKNTFLFLSDLDVSYLHIFPYSERDNTTAIEMNESVPLKERQARANILRTLSEKKKKAFYKSQFGKKLKVLFEEGNQNGLMHGFTENYVKVEAPYDPLLINEIVEIQSNTFSENGNLLLKSTNLATV